MIKFIIFVICSLYIVIVSWKPLKDLSSHGFYRFFVFELVVVLFLLNIDYWLNDPLSLLQIISWVLLFGSIYPVLAGLRLLKVIGKPDQQIESETNYKFEKTTNLVTDGIYKYIRHPMYASLFYLGWGIYFKHIDVAQTVVLILLIIFLYLTAAFEEKENIKHFGEEYKAYMKTTKMFVPLMF